MGTYDLQRYISFLGEYLQQQNFEAADKTDRATRIQDNFLYLKEAAGKDSDSESNMAIVKEARARKSLHKSTNAGPPRLDLRKHVFETNAEKSARSAAHANKLQKIKANKRSADNTSKEQEKNTKVVPPSKPNNKVEPAQKQKPVAKPVQPAMKQKPATKPAQPTKPAAKVEPAPKQKPVTRAVSMPKLNDKAKMLKDMKSSIKSTGVKADSKLNKLNTSPAEKEGNNVKLLNPNTPAKVKGILNKADKVKIAPPKGVSLKNDKSKRAWVEALEKTASMGELITPAGKPNYSLIMSNYVSSYMGINENISEQDYAHNANLIKKARYQRSN